MKVSRIMFSVATALMISDLALAAPIAVVSESSGQVSVQTSKGIVPALPGTQLSEGDRVAVGRGSATLSYLSGKCKGAREVGPQSIAVISSAEQQCSKSIEGAKAQSLDPNIPDVLIPVALLAVGGGIACGLACGGGGSASAPFLPRISP